MSAAAAADAPAAYSAKDVLNANTYASERAKLMMIRALRDEFPHISVGLDVTVHIADPKVHYYYPDEFAHRALVVDVQFSEHMCKKLSCSIRRWGGQCTPDDVAVNERIGDSNEHATRCQPACFNMSASTPVRDRDGKPMPQTPNLAWNAARRKCVMRSNAFLYMDYPKLRSVTEKRHVTDQPVGFNRVTGAVTATGERYYTNETYCRTFHKRFDPVTRDCIRDTYHKVVGTLVGDQIIDYSDDAFRLMTVGQLYPEPPPIPAPPVEPFLATVAGWRGDTCATATDQRAAACDILQNISMDMDVPDGATRAPPYDDANEGVADAKPKKNDISAEASSTTPQPPPVLPGAVDDALTLLMAPSGAGGAHPNTVARKIAAFVSQAFPHDKESIKTFSKLFGPLMTDLALRKALAQALKSLPAMMAKLAETIAVEASVEAVTTALAGTVAKLMVETLVTEVISTMITSAIEAATPGLDIVGIVLAALSVISLILALTDPLGYNNIVNNDALYAVLLAADLDLRQTWSRRSLDITFTDLMLMTIGKERYLSYVRASVVYALEYLSNLKVNADGSAIADGPRMTKRDLLARATHASRILNGSGGLHDALTADIGSPLTKADSSRFDRLMRDAQSARAPVPVDYDTQHRWRATVMQRLTTASLGAILVTASMVWLSRLSLALVLLVLLASIQVLSVRNIFTTDITSVAV